MQASGKSNVLGFSKGSPPKSNKVKKVENQEHQDDSIKELARLIKQMEEVYINQLSAMHNKIVVIIISQMIDGKRVSLKDPLIKNKKDLQSLWKQTIGLMIQ